MRATGRDPATTRTGYVHTAGEYLRELATLALAVDTNAVAAVTERIVETLAAGRTVFVAGNGGSAAAATHMVCDWLTTARLVGHRAARVVGLADNPAVVTALANDVSFTEVFAQQLRLMAQPGDLLVLLSVSGESANLVEAARAAKAEAVGTVGLLGNRGDVAALCDIVVELGDGDFGFTEDLHMAINHIVVRAINGGAPRRHPRPEARLAGHR